MTDSVSELRGSDFRLAMVCWCCWTLARAAATATGSMLDPRLDGGPELFLLSELALEARLRCEGELIEASTTC